MIKKYRVTGWIQATFFIDDIISAENEDEACISIYYQHGDVHNCELKAEEIE